MARRRRYHGITSVSLGQFPIGLNDSVTVMDVLAGAAVGVAGSALLKGLLNKFGGETYAKLKGSVGPAMPLLASVGTAAALYYAQKGSNRARGHAVGAVAAGAAATLLGYLPKLTEAAGVTQYFDFSDVVSVNLGGLGNYSGLLVADQSDAMNGYNAYNGLLVADQSDSLNGLIVADRSDSLNELAAYSMGEESDDGLTSLSAM